MGILLFLGLNNSFFFSCQMVKQTLSTNLNYFPFNFPSTVFKVISVSGEGGKDLNTYSGLEHVNITSYLPCL